MVISIDRRCAKNCQMISAIKAAVIFLSVLLLGACALEQGSQKTVVDTSSGTDIYSDYLNRDVRDDIFYFVLPDRFDNGNPANDTGSDVHAVSSGGFDPTSKSHFHGGDLQGLKRRLPYLKEMGVSAIWMTPILRNKAVQGDSTGYHGYWVVDFTELDPHFGTNADLKDLIDSAHEMGMKVFFDIITNHTADVIKYRECHDGSGVHINQKESNCAFKSSEDLASGKEKPYTPFIPNKEKSVKVPAWLNDPKYYHNQGDSFWQGESSLKGDFVGLDDLNTAMPEVIEGMIDIYKDIVSNFRPDGFRVDTVKHVHLPFWQQFVPAIMEHAKAEGIPNFHMFGEVYGGDPAFLSQYTTIGKMPAILDFGFQGATGAVIANTKSPQSLQALFDDDDYYNDHDSQADMLLSFIGSHDIGRFGFFLNQNFPKASDEEKLQRSILAHALMYFSRGIPVVYYGDEQGFTGDGIDKDARENMMPSRVASYNDNRHLGSKISPAQNNFDSQHPIYLALKDFAKLYREHKALRRGVHHHRFAAKESGIYAFSRLDLDEKVEYLLVFNSATVSKKISLDASAKSYRVIAGANQDLQSSSGKVTLSVPPLQFAIYRATAPVAAAENLEIKLRSVERDSRSANFIDIDFEIEGADKLPVPVLAVTTEYKDVEGQFKLASIDYTLPYSSKVELKSIARGLEGEIRVTLDNLSGNKTTRVIHLSGK